MRLKSKDSIAFLRKKGFEDISTGGCLGWYIKRGKHTFYITTTSNLTLPTKHGEDISVGVYDEEFEHQYMSYDFKKFSPSKLMLYVGIVERRMKSKVVKSQIEKNPDQILYYPRTV